MSGRILIVDDVATNRIVLKVKLGEACYETALASDAANCFRVVKETAPDLILLDRDLPDRDGIEVLRRLRSDPAARDLAIIMTLGAGSVDARLTALNAGADDVMTKPLDEPLLMARMRALLRARTAARELRERNAALGAIGLAEAATPFERPGLVALVTDRPETALHLRKLLATHLGDRLIIQSRDEVLGDAPPNPEPDVYVIEQDIGSAGGGLRLMSDLRSRGIGRDAGMCILQTNKSGDGAGMALDYGADDVVANEADPREIAIRLRRLVARKRREDRLRAKVNDGLRLAVFDPLTGLHNRRHAMARLGRMLERTRRGGAEFAVISVDLDRFKAVNDAFGHPGGDKVLVEVARRLSQNLRTDDLLARFGGEEFLIALPDTSLHDAQLIADRLCRSINETAITLDNDRSLSVTASIGLKEVVAAELTALDCVETILAQTDRALMTSKKLGRNQVTVCLPAA
ncbi:MAG: diguanylate cyclase response regulator [Cereibacter sphaeroides]|uniref:diguanylate cyclase n=1 Tax=Cereibacter sphaeroides TaxID=1063 RepID=A0A2W5SGS1_CERSP|nr:MAG: diguanylate cyclase response regulator [Cereibacter sphaeroides]